MSRGVAWGAEEGRTVAETQGRCAMPVVPSSTGAAWTLGLSAPSGSEGSVVIGVGLRHTSARKVVIGAFGLGNVRVSGLGGALASYDAAYYGAYCYDDAYGGDYDERLPSKAPYLVVAADYTLFDGNKTFLSSAQLFF